MEQYFTSIEGNAQKLDGGAMFGNAPKALWSRWAEPDEHNRIRLSCRSLLMEMEGLNILFETGIGAFFEPKMAARFGVENPNTHILQETLNQNGPGCDSIDYVILSHMHFDHAGGLLSAYQEGREQELIFPKAKFVVGEEAFARAQTPHPRDRASFVPGLCEKLQQSGRLFLVGADLKPPQELAERVEFFISHGHTVGQLHSIVKGSQKKLVFCGDLVPGSAWVHAPLSMGYDRYPERLIEEKLLLYKKAIEGWFLFFTHDPLYAGGFLKKDPKGRYAVHKCLKELKKAVL